MRRSGSGATGSSTPSCAASRSSGSETPDATSTRSAPRPACTTCRVATGCASTSMRSGLTSTSCQRTKTELRELLDHVAVRLGAAVAVELPDAADFLDQVEVHLGADELVVVFRRGGEEVAARVDDVAGAVELADVPR